MMRGHSVAPRGKFSPHGRLCRLALVSSFRKSRKGRPMKCFLSLQLILVLTAGTPFACPAADDFPDPVNTQAAGEHPPSPQEMLELFELPPGFNVTLFAGEPNVQQPIAFDFDDRGRIWVAENYSYGAHGEYDADHRDRVIILHDTDGDGQHDERKVFWDKGWMLTGLTWGFGGLWILNDGSLSFIPDKDADDVPDSEPVEMLNGWTKGAGHNFVNGLLWGPDGWLYGRHGITETSLPGRPDVPKEERQPMNCGIWRFHPTKHTFEIVCHGTTNPWGLDYNESGDMFMSNNVIGHLWHVIPGAHYERMFGQDFNPHLYELMGQAADHYHWDHTGKWTESRDDHAEDLGGGHSHCGLMIYQGQNFPEEYHGKAFMFNTHGRCINVDRLERKGSSYVAKHEPNFLKVNTPWFRGIELKYGPRGCVYLTDWSDNGECHDHDGVHRTSGRIYRIAYGEVSSSDNATLQFAPNVSLDELLNQVLIPKDHVWHARRATRL
ncbi:MAG TPA: cytochrome C, partial [Fuerstia sp.]|nr:cytochrome C [Fuerstiella sp.]